MLALEMSRFVAQIKRLPDIMKELGVDPRHHRVPDAVH